MDDQTKQTLIARYIAAYNAFDVEGMLAQLAEDVRFEHFAGGALSAATDGIEAFRRIAEQSKALFSEREQRVTALRIASDHAIVSIDYRGRLAADIPDGPRAGSLLSLHGQSEFWFTAGKISKIVDRS